MSSGNSKKIWRLTNEVISNQTTTKSQVIVQVKYNGKLTENLLQSTEAFNDFFTTVGDEITRTISPTLQKIRNIPFPKLTTAILSDFEPTSTNEIATIIKNLPNHSAPGYDNITTSFIKTNLNFFALYLSVIINDCLITAQFPDCLKIGRVTPIHKSDTKEEVQNYRPISVLSTISKNFEIIIKNRLETYLQENKLIHHKQFGFVQKSSTTSACTSLIHEIHQLKKKHKMVACTFVDLKKAFDCVEYECLKNILESYGICGTALKLICNYHAKQKTVCQFSKL